MRYWLVTCAALAASSVPLLSCAAAAATIDYIFTGAGSWTLNGVKGSGAFTITYVADTSTITSSGGEFMNSGVGTFVSGPTTAILTGDVNEVIDITATPGFIGFTQIAFSPFNVGLETLINPAFETYSLSRAFPLTSGPLNPPTAAIFRTDAGELAFTDDSLTSLSFQATGGVPEPSTWALMLAGFAGLAFAGYRGTSRGVAIAG